MPSVEISISQTFLNPDKPNTPPSVPQMIKVEEGQRINLLWDNKSFHLSLKKIAEEHASFFTDTLLVNTANQHNPNPTPVDFELRLKDSVMLTAPSNGSSSLWEVKLEKIYQNQNYQQESLPPKNNLPAPVPSDTRPIKPIPAAPIPSAPKIGPIPVKPTAPANPPAIKPAIKIRLPKIKWKDTQEIIAQVENKLNTKIITYYTSPVSFIDDNHAEMFIDHLNNHNPGTSLSFVPISNGGSVTAALRIASLIKEHFPQINILVPSRCASSATIISLVGDKIYLSPSGYLTAIDSTSTHPLNPKGPDGRPVSMAVDQVRRILKFLTDEGTDQTEDRKMEGPYRTLFKYIHPLAIGQIARSSSLSELVAIKVMRLHSSSFESEEKIKTIASRLVNEYPSHGFPVLYNEAEEIGLPVEKMDKEVSDLLWNLVKCYDSISNLTLTNITPEFHHIEEFPVIIESKDKRTMRHISLDERLNPAMKLWFKENDNTKWINIKPPESADRDFEVVPLDALEKEPPPILHNQEPLTQGQKNPENLT